MSNRAGKNTNTEAIRTFICIDISESIKARLGALQNDLRRLEAQVSWVKPANIHLTVKFLGDVPQPKMSGIVEAARRAIGSCSPFQIDIKGTGCFPSPRRPNILWVGLAALPEALINLHKGLEDELAGQGLARDTKAFRPHLTIGRLRQPRNAQRLAEELLNRGFAAESFPASEVIVMRSDLSPHGAIYTPQAVIPLSS
jgi:2'-5' RNA ligase